jgi:hypothetical protein
MIDPSDDEVSVNAAIVMRATLAKHPHPGLPWPRSDP